MQPDEWNGIMKSTSLSLVIGLILAPLAADAQTPPEQLSLRDAIALALEHNPEYQIQLGEEPVAEWGVRSAYAAFLPTATVSGGMSYQGSGQARLGNFTSGDIGLGRTPSYYFSSYSVGLQVGLDGSTFYRVGQERGARDVVRARMDVAELGLRASVTRQYLGALRMRDAVALARAELERAQANLGLAEARYAVESLTLLEVRQAEVERGRAAVELLRAEAGYETEKLRLLQLMGVDVEAPIELTTDVRIFEPRWESESLVRLAMSAQPDLDVARASAAVAGSEVGMARSAFWPRLALTTGLAGYTRRVGSDQFLIDQAERQMSDAAQQCIDANNLLSRLNPPMPPMDCSQFAFTDEMRASILDQNRQFPFNFDREPLSMSVGISVPVFQGLTRQRQLERAHANNDAARYRLRGEELKVRADVLAALGSLRAAYQAVQLEDRTRDLADDQLRLAQERYRVGVASFIELLEAETMKARADRSHLLGVYAFQEALAALEAAIGQELAIPED
jgi:outer membrane protein